MLTRRIALVILPAALLALSACGSDDEKPSKSAATTKGAAAGTACGQVTTAGKEPVTLKVMQGSAPCEEAKAVFTEFFGMIASGKAPGNGGGGQIQVKGWTCAIYPATDIERTGRGADCQRAGTLVAAWHKMS